MAFVTLPYIIRSLRSVTAAEMKAMYQAIADVVNGTLDARNFGKHLRIPNAHKQEPYGVSLVTGYHDGWTGAAATDYVEIPVPDEGAEIIAWSVLAGNVQVGVLAASTIELGHRFQSAGGNVLVDSGSLSATTAAGPYPADWPGVIESRNPAAAAYVMGLGLERVLAAPAAIPAGKKLYVYPSVLTYGGGAVEIPAVRVAVWLRSLHLP